MRLWSWDSISQMSKRLKLLWRLISIRAPLPSLVSVSSYKDVAVVVVLREKQHRCCFHCLFSAVVFLLLFLFLYFLSRIIKTISLYDETFTDPLQLPNRTPDQLLGLQLLYRKQTDLYAWKKESSNQKYQIYKQTTWDISPVERHRVHSTAFIIKLSVYRYNC